MIRVGGKMVQLSKLRRQEKRVYDNVIRSQERKVFFRSSMRQNQFSILKSHKALKVSV